LENLLAEIVRYPTAQTSNRTARFIAQLLAWRWYYSEAVRQKNQYLIFLALQKITLFSCRIVLTQNEMLYPYHKWLLSVAESAPRRPSGFPDNIRQLLIGHSWESVDTYSQAIIAFAGVNFAEADAIWPTLFMKDTELKWMTEEPPIDDL
jgi:hypothetical protein